MSSYFRSQAFGAILTMAVLAVPVGCDTTFDYAGDGTGDGSVAGTSDSADPGVSQAVTSVSEPSSDAASEAPTVLPAASSDLLAVADDPTAITSASPEPIATPDPMATNPPEVANETSTPNRYSQSEPESSRDSVDALFSEFLGDSESKQDESIASSGAGASSEPSVPAGDLSDIPAGPTQPPASKPREELSAQDLFGSTLAQREPSPDTTQATPEPSKESNLESDSNELSLKDFFGDLATDPDPADAQLSDAPPAAPMPAKGPAAVSSPGEASTVPAFVDVPPGVTDSVLVAPSAGDPMLGGAYAVKPKPALPPKPTPEPAPERRPVAELLPEPKEQQSDATSELFELPPLPPKQPTVSPATNVPTNTDPSNTLPPATLPPTALPPTKISLDNTRHQVWVLGSKVSLSVLAEAAEQPLADSDETWQLQALAEMLGVDAPEFTAAGKPAEAVAELLRETRSMADQLAPKLGDDHAAILEVAVKTNLLLLVYEKNPKLAAPIRRAVQAASIRASLPEDVCQPLMDLLEGTPTADEVRAEVFRLHQAVEQTLQATTR